jgi:acetyl-CoA acetyltransferase
VDEGIRFDATLEGIAGVKLLQPKAAAHAANASQICDGASGVMVVNERGLKALGVAAAGAHPPHDGARRRPGDHAGGAAAGHRGWR